MYPSARKCCPRSSPGSPRVAGWSARRGDSPPRAPPPAPASPHPPMRRLINAFEQLLADTHGADFRWGRQRLPTALAEAGLVELGMSMSVKCVGDGGPAEAFYRSS